MPPQNRGKVASIHEAELIGSWENSWRACKGYHEPNFRRGRPTKPIGTDLAVVARLRIAPLKMVGQTTWFEHAPFRDDGGHVGRGCNVEGGI